MEIRFVKPYFSSIAFALNEVVVGVPSIGTNGQQQIQAQAKQRSIDVNITGWLAGQQVRSDTFSFEGEQLEIVLSTAKQIGVDVPKRGPKHSMRSRIHSQ